MSLSPVATRFLITLGAAAELVGIDAESSRIPGAAGLPVVDLETARELDPRLVLVAELPPIDDPAAAGLWSDGVRIVEFSPHDLEDVFALCRGLGAELVGVAAATEFERGIARPLALIGGRSASLGRPRIVAVVDFEPLTLAGGHSFETDLIEIAGGTSVTHGGDESRIVPTLERWGELAPDLALVTVPEEPTDALRDAAMAAIPDGYPVKFFVFDRETFWLHGPDEEAERLYAEIATLTPQRPGFR